MPSTHARDDYGIPPNGEILGSEHLRRQASFVLKQGGRIHLGKWGFFRDPGEGPANRFALDAGSVSVQGLAFRTRQGLVLCAAAGSAPVAEGALVARWTLPKDRDDSDTDRDATLQVGAATSGDPDAVEAKLGCVFRIGGIHGVNLLAPALSIDALDALADRWARTVAEVARLSELISRSALGEPLAKALIEEAIVEARTLGMCAEPAWATTVLARATTRMYAFAQATGVPPEVEDELDALAESAHESMELARGPVTALENALEVLGDRARAMDRTRDWLRPRGTPIACAGRTDRAGELEERSYALDGEPSGTLQLRIEEKGPERPTIRCRIDEALIQPTVLRASAGGFEATIGIAERDRGKTLRVICRRGLALTVSVLAEGRDG